MSQRGEAAPPGFPLRLDILRPSGQVAHRWTYGANGVVKRQAFHRQIVATIAAFERDAIRRSERLRASGSFRSQPIRSTGFLPSLTIATEIGRASCRESGWKTVWISGGAVYIKKQKQKTQQDK